MLKLNPRGDSLQAEWILAREAIEVRLESRVSDVVLKMLRVKTIQIIFSYLSWRFIDGEIPFVGFEFAKFRSFVVGLHGELLFCNDDFEGCAEMILDEILYYLQFGTSMKSVQFNISLIHLGGFSRNVDKLRSTRYESSSGKGCFRKILN